ncbi:MAG TPA: AEC family transporter [Candidatus Cloacimonetes bacterium]|nr:AEC family transporter [Candidatus Cloacimonas sp.]HHZ15330.1 AEC family transporter [Candidatus Cloacimonadota bacterium]
MQPFIEKIFPLFLAFFVGIIARQLKLLSKKDAPILLKTVLNVCLPAVAILAINRMVLQIDLIFIPISAMLIVFGVYAVSKSLEKVLKLPRATYGSFLVGTLVANSAFALPFLAASHQEQGLAMASLFDIGNSIMIFTFIYYQSVKYGDSTHDGKIDWRKFLKMPPLWAFAFAFILKAFNVEFPALAVNFLELMGSPTVPLVMISLGLYFEPSFKQLEYALLAVLIRMGVGLALGFALSYIFGLTGLVRTVVISCSALPIGFNTLIFADIENLDREFAATEVSISMIVAMFLIPWLIWRF